MVVKFGQKMLQSIFNFQDTAISSVGVALAQLYLKKCFYVLFEPWVKTCSSDEERKLRAGKGAYSIFKLIYFVGATIWGWKILNK